MSIARIFFLSVICMLTGLQSGIAWALTTAEFRSIIDTIEAIPYNPRPIAEDQEAVTGSSRERTRDDFLDAFTRVEIPAPANGRTYAATDPENLPDITLVGYLRIQPRSTPPAGWPWVIVTHGGAGMGSIAVQDMLPHIANVLYNNGWNVLAIDKRDGLLSRCGYSTADLDGDGAYDVDNDHSVKSFVLDSSKSRYCEILPARFRKPGYEANSLPSGRSSFEAGDLLAAAKYIRDNYGAPKIALLGGSHGGLAAIRAAAIMGTEGVDFRGDLLDTVIAISPVADHNSIQYDAPRGSYECDRAAAAKFYSWRVPGTGLGNFSEDPVAVLDQFYATLNGVHQLDNVSVPTLIIYTLADETDVARSAFAYAAKTAKKRLAYTMLMSRLGHFNEIWQSDPYWMDQVVLTFFKSVLQPATNLMFAYPGFDSAGPRTENPYLLRFNLRKFDPDIFLSLDSISGYLVGGTDGDCLSALSRIGPD